MHPAELYIARVSHLQVTAYEISMIEHPTSRLGANVYYLDTLYI